MERVLVGFGPKWKGVGLQHTRGLLGPSVNRWSIKRSPNGTKLDRRSTGSKPRPLGKSRSNPEMFKPHTRKKGRNDHRRRTKHRNAKRRQNPTTREFHNLEPKMARDGVQLWQVTSGVLQHSTTTKGSCPECWKYALEAIIN